MVLGDVAISTREKDKALDEKHHIVDRSKETASKAWEQAKECNRWHNVLDAKKDTVVSSWGAFVKFVKERQLLERGVDGGLNVKYRPVFLSKLSDLMF